MEEAKAMAEIGQKFNSLRASSNFVPAKTKEQFRYDKNGVRITKPPLKRSDATIKNERQTLEDVEREKKRIDETIKNFLRGSREKVENRRKSMIASRSSTRSNPDFSNILTPNRQTLKFEILNSPYKNEVKKT